MKYFSIIFFIISLLSCSSKSQEPDLKWILPAADYDRQDFPVRIVIPGDIDSEEGQPLLSELIDEAYVNVPCQLSEGKPAILSWVAGGTTKAGQERNYALSFKKGKAQDPVMKVGKNDTSLLISKYGKPLFHYRYAELPAPEGQSYLFARSGFIHPLYSPSGKELTWAQPPDHFHHMGLWNPWTKVTWKGNHTDFWNLGEGMGTVRFSDIISMESGPVYTEFTVLQDHVAFVPPKSPEPDEEYTGDEVIVMEEEWIIRVWNVDDGYLLDFTSLIRNILDEQISLDTYRYGGGIGFRATAKWNKDNSTVLTSEGKNRAEGDATRAKWCWISGDLDGKLTGLLFMSDPGNYDFPQPMRIWPENSNGVGHQYFEFTPIREKDWRIDPGISYTQDYRIWVKEGQLDPILAESQWRQYAESPDQKILYLSK